MLGRMRLLKREDWSHLLRHCEPPGRRVAPPDDRLREAIQGQGKSAYVALDCFAPLAMTVSAARRMG